jgi:hypothetical protein
MLSADPTIVNAIAFQSDLVMAGNLPPAPWLVNYIIAQIRTAPAVPKFMFYLPRRGTIGRTVHRRCAWLK